MKKRRREGGGVDVQGRKLVSKGKSKCVVGRKIVSKRKSK